MTATRTPKEVNAEILAGLNVKAEYEALGVKFSGAVRQSGKISCHAFGREDRNPSAWVDTRSGHYGDSGGHGAAAFTCSLWDFAVRAGRYADWKKARRFYASKAGVTIGREKKPDDKINWREKLEFQADDTPGNDVLILRWCMQHKPGVTPEAIRAAGGRVAYYPCWMDKKTRERRRGSRQVIAMPAYGEYLLAADPVAWVLWDITGQPFEVGPPDNRQQAKMISIGPTSGAMMGLSSLMVLSDPELRAGVEWAWKVEGPADMLALWTAIPEADRARHVVVTNAGGATSNVMPWQSKLLAGVRGAVVGDCDEAGQVGAEKWCRALDGVAEEIRNVRLPWPVEPSHGNDVRDFLIGKDLA